MPTYLYKCPTCASQRDIVKKLADIDRTEHCLKCDFPMNRQICAPRVVADYPGYNCPITGEWIEGRRAHEENLAKHGCRVLEPGETEEAQRAAAAKEEAFLEEVGETAAKLVASMPSDKQERLANELDAGLGVSYDRKVATPTT